VFSIIFIAEEIDGMGEKIYGMGEMGSGDIKIIDVQTDSEAFLNMTPRSVCFNNEAFFWEKAQLLVLGQPSSAT
jgi:hypothetical protein